MNWIENIVKKSTPIEAYSSKEDELVSVLLDVAKSENLKCSLGTKLAAFYDLAISSVYYTNITNTGWLYCNLNSPKLILPFVNCCPEHALQGDYVFHKSSKPTSAKIGQATTRMLLLFFQKLFDLYDKNLIVLKATEPADAIFYNKQEKRIFLGEIKSSPLLTLALCSPCEVQTSYDDDDNIIEIKHSTMSNPFIIGKELFVEIPVKIDGVWKTRNYSIGMKRSATDEDFAYDGLIRLIQDKNFIKDYIDYWTISFDAYCKKDDTENIFWLTNACGKPSKLPNDWTGGVTCISDEKTSVGMDRTDDIKKGIYQVLKLGAEGKLEKTGWKCKVGILSNIHPARHFNAYLKPIKDLIWTITDDKNIEFAKDLDPNLPMYNLFDGIITFTDNYIRDKWIMDNLNMLEK